MPPRRRCKVDANQPLIVEILRKRGFQVKHMHMVGEGFPDLIANRAGNSFFIEIKDGRKAKLTDAQKTFHDEWCGSKIHIIRTGEDALKFPNHERETIDN